tara:strand:- start:851 stop:1660 length:810 start_codon:yes stop_codon:yes gene_type:complete
MKKDYIPIDNNTFMNEGQFVEHYWSAIWNKYEIKEQIESVIEEKEELKIIAPYINNLSKKSRILDGGCGVGQWVIYFLKKEYDVIGTDISKTTINRLNELFPSYKFVVEDIRNTSFKDNYFDAYYSWGVFEHFEIGPGPCFKEAHRILKREGYLFVSVPYQNKRHLRRDQRELFNWDNNFDKEKGYQQSMRFYQYRFTKPELKREFEINGFKCMSVKSIAKKDGIIRFMNEDLNISSTSKLHRIIYRFLFSLMPKEIISHMILGIGIKK